MIIVTVLELKDEARPLWQEAKELNLILNSIYDVVDEPHFTRICSP